jgi:hypothetical protein
MIVYFFQPETVNQVAPEPFIFKTIPLLNTQLISYRAKAKLTVIIYCSENHSLVLKKIKNLDFQKSASQLSWWQYYCRPEINTLHNTNNISSYMHWN